MTAGPLEVISHDSFFHAGEDSVVVMAGHFQLEELLELLLLGLSNSAAVAVLTTLLENLLINDVGGK